MWQRILNKNVEILHELTLTPFMQKDNPSGKQFTLLSAFQSQCIMLCVTHQGFGLFRSSLSPGSGFCFCYGWRVVIWPMKASCWVSTDQHNVTEKVKTLRRIQEEAGPKLRLEGVEGRGSLASGGRGEGDGISHNHKGGESGKFHLSSWIMIGTRSSGGVQEQEGELRITRREMNCCLSPSYHCQCFLAVDSVVAQKSWVFEWPDFLCP